jgi:Uroporphyrinogen-III synthase
MQKDKIHILSTRPLPAGLTEEARQLGIWIDETSFIETEPIRSVEVQQEIEQALIKFTAVVFTSMNAVEAVTEELDGALPEWKIFCIGNTTREVVEKYFGENTIAGTADNALALAEEIIQDEEIDEVTFFCGDQRRDELPDALRQNDIEVIEVVVYNTIPIPQKIEKNYHGILFFSPSAVESFFKKNKIPDQTYLFAIGNTTAATIKKYTTNKIIIAKEPGKENLVRQMMEYYS